MKRLVCAGILGALATGSLATDRWTFSERIAVTPPTAAGVFHHLEGSGRKHIAVSSGSVAITWEDDHSSDPQVYVATRSASAESFGRALQVSSGSEAYEPAISALADDRFVLAWEQDGFVFTRLLTTNGLGPVRQLADNASGQVSLASNGEHAIAAWRELRAGKWNLFTAYLTPEADNGITTATAHPVEREDSATPVLYPAISLSDSGIHVAWEDRRAGHTRIKQAFSADGGKAFSSPQYLNEFHSNRSQYDKGSGATRVALAPFGGDEVVAAWMDKRRGNTGYGIFASLGSEDAFGPNEKVHGEPGDTLPHYNPAVAGNADGDFVIAWDDYRNGTSDIWLSGYTDDGEWSEDFAPPPASGDGEQSHVSAALDRDGNLHLVWIERNSIDAPTRIWYSRGERR